MTLPIFREYLKSKIGVLLYGIENHKLDKGFP